MFEFFKEIHKTKSKIDRLVDFVETVEDVHNVVKVTKAVVNTLDSSNSNKLRENVETTEPKSIDIEKNANMTMVEQFKEFESYALDLSDNYWVNNYEEYAKWYREMKKRQKNGHSNKIDESSNYAKEKKYKSFLNGNQTEGAPAGNHRDILDEKIKNQTHAKSTINTKQVEFDEIQSKGHLTIFDELCIKFDSFDFFTKSVMCIAVLICIIALFGKR